MLRIVYVYWVFMAPSNYFSSFHQHHFQLAFFPSESLFMSVRELLLQEKFILFSWTIFNVLLTVHPIIIIIIVIIKWQHKTKRYTLSTTQQNYWTQRQIANADFANNLMRQ
jgi:hypothetical protein